MGEKQKAQKKKKKKKKVGENNGQLRFRPPPRMAHATRLDQKQNIFQEFNKLNLKNKNTLESRNTI